MRKVISDIAGTMLWGVFYLFYYVEELAWLWVFLLIILAYPALIGFIYLFY